MQDSFFIYLKAFARQNDNLIRKYSFQMQFKH